MNDAADVELLGDQGIALVTRTFGISLYTDVRFMKAPQAVLGAFDVFRGLCPAQELRWYATENMKQHKAVTKKTLDLLKTWLKPGAPARESVMLEIKNGIAFNATPDWRFTVIGGEPGSPDFEAGEANVVSMALPMDWAAEHLDQVYGAVHELCVLFPYQSVLAGYSMDWSRYAQSISHQHAWAKGMRYRGMDIAWPSLERAAVLHDSVRGVGWLTVLCDAFVKRLGGATAVRTLKAPVEVMDVPRGVLLKAGATPTVGDVNRGDELAAYRHVFRMLQPLIEPVIPRYPTFSLRADRRDNTTAWLRRLADAP